MENPIQKRKIRFQLQILKFERRSVLNKRIRETKKPRKAFQNRYYGKFKIKHLYI